MTQFFNEAPSGGFRSLGLAGKRCLFVASTGGHLGQLVRIVNELGASPESRIVTFDSPQSRSLDVDLGVEFVPYIAPRDVTNTLRAVRRFRTLVRSGRYDAVVSTGAAIAVAALPVAAAARVRGLYIESYSRFTSPSVTGKILSSVPGLELYTQHRSWAGGRWSYTGSIIDAVRAAAPRTVQRSAESSNRPKAFVTLGTIRPYRFDALVDRVLQVVPEGYEIVWQLGETRRDDVAGDTHDQMDRRDFAAVAASSDVIISHAGTGTAIDLVEMGHRPIIVPRRAHRGEHVDDHQLQIARDLADRELVVLREVEDLSTEDFRPLPVEARQSA